MSTRLNEFVAQAARPLPVIILADTSGSMAADGKIDALNQSLREMLATFSTTDDLRAEIYVAIITFGGEARLRTHLMPARAGSARGPRCKQARRGPSLSAQFDSAVSAAKTAATARATSATATAAAIAATATTVGATAR